MNKPRIIATSIAPLGLNPNGMKVTMRPFETQTDLLLLERQRDRLVERLERLCAEPDNAVVEGFQYVDHDGLTGEERARVARGRLACSTLRAINDVNRQICAIIAPGFRTSPSVGFSERVMQAVGGVR